MWSYIKKAINTNINKALDVLIGEKAAEINNNTNARKNEIVQDTAWNRDIINSRIERVEGLINRGVVKSLQRGTASFKTNSPYENSGNMRIPIAAINPNKAIVILNGGGSSSGELYLIRLDELTTNTLKVHNCRKDGTSTFSLNDVIFSWQVIEFY